MHWLKLGTGFNSVFNLISSSFHPELCWVAIEFGAVSMSFQLSLVSVSMRFYPLISPPSRVGL